MAEIKTNSRGVSKLLLSYPLALRLRGKAMAGATGLSEQEIIRRAIDQLVTAWETEQPVKPAKKTRTRKAVAR